MLRQLLFQNCATNYVRMEFNLEQNVTLDSEMAVWGVLSLWRWGSPFILFSWSSGVECWVIFQKYHHIHHSSALCYILLKTYCHNLVGLQHFKFFCGIHCVNVINEDSSLFSTHSLTGVCSAQYCSSKHADQHYKHIILLFLFAIHNIA